MVTYFDEKYANEYNAVMFSEIVDLLIRDKKTQEVERAGYVLWSYNVVIPQRKRNVSPADTKICLCCLWPGHVQN